MRIELPARAIEAGQRVLKDLVGDFARAVGRRDHRMRPVHAERDLARERYLEPLKAVAADRFAEAHHRWLADVRRPGQRRDRRVHRTVRVGDHDVRDLPLGFPEERQHALHPLEHMQAGIVADDSELRLCHPAIARFLFGAASASSRFSTAISPGADVSERGVIRIRLTTRAPEAAARRRVPKDARTQGRLSGCRRRIRRRSRVSSRAGSRPSRPRPSASAWPRRPAPAAER